MKDKIWFTFKARIQAHKRLEWLDLHSQYLLVWYAILSGVLAVVTIRYQDVLGVDTDLYAAILSVALLGVSLAVANRDFRGRALLMRKNYLGLQSLYRDIDVVGALTSEHVKLYDDLLAEAENHETIDDRVARVFATSLTSRHPTAFEHLHARYWLLQRAVVTIALYAAPIVAAVLAWKSK